MLLLELNFAQEILLTVEVLRMWKLNFASGLSLNLPSIFNAFAEVLCVVVNCIVIIVN